MGYSPLFESITMHYSVHISSEEAEDITVYVPIPHYKGKPYKRVLWWMRKELANDIREAKSYSEKKRAERLSKIKLDLVKTKYGTMLKIYSPKYGAWFSIERNISINEDTVTYDYKLTYEDKATPLEERINPKHEKEVEKKLPLPIYVKFKGEKLRVRYFFHVAKSFRSSWYYFFRYGLGTHLLEYKEESIRKLADEWQKESEENSVFTKSGWHKVAVVKFEKIIPFFGLK
jgi:hypothetical protein